jgi:hypothetical protein
VTSADWGMRRTAFGSQAAAYARGRPSYPEDAVTPPGTFVFPHVFEVWRGERVD